MGAPTSTADKQTDRLLFALRQRILQGEFRPGERLTELGLVSLVNASRTPIRLALERLAHEGLLEKQSSGGFRVRSFSLPEIWDAIEIRGVLEGTAARFAAERLQSPDELHLLRTLNEDAELHTSVEAFARYLELNDRFHREIWRLAKSTSLLRALEAATALPFAAPGALVFTEADSTQSAAFGLVAAEHHRSLVEAIENREGARAEALAREHSRVARRNLQFALGDKELITQLPGATLIAST